MSRKKYEMPEIAASQDDESGPAIAIGQIEAGTMVTPELLSGMLSDYLTINGESAISASCREFDNYGAIEFEVKN